MPCPLLPPALANRLALSQQYADAVARFNEAISLYSQDQRYGGWGNGWSLLSALGVLRSETLPNMESMSVSCTDTMATGPSVTSTLGITKSEVHTSLSGGTSPDSPTPLCTYIEPSKMPRCHCAFPPIGRKGTSGGERPSLVYRYAYEGAPPISRHDPTPFALWSSNTPRPRRLTSMC